MLAEAVVDDKGALPLLLGKVLAAVYFLERLQVLHFIYSNSNTYANKGLPGFWGFGVFGFWVSDLRFRVCLGFWILDFGFRV